MEFPIERVNLLEKDIEDWLWANASALNCRQFTIVEWIGRQVKLPSGIADLVGYGHDGGDGNRLFPVIVEVKNVPIKTEALGQVMRYGYDVLCVFDAAMGDEERPPVEMHAQHIVVGTSIDNATFAEAVAMDIAVFTFRAHVHVQIDGQVRWAHEYQEKVYQQRQEIATGDLFAGALDFARGYRDAGELRNSEGSEGGLNGDKRNQIPPEYRDIVKR